MTRSSNFTSAELNVLLTSLEANRELALGEFSASTTTVAQRKREWTILADLINAVGNSNRTCQSVRQKWFDLKSRTKKKALELKQMGKTDGGPTSNKLTDIEKRILQLISPGYEMESSTPDLHSRNESFVLPDASASPYLATLEYGSSDEEQKPSTTQDKSYSEEEGPKKIPLSSFMLKDGTPKSLSFKDNSIKKRRGSLLHEKIKSSIKTSSNVNEKLSDIKALLQESVKLQKQMLENQKLELMLLAKIADAELLYDE